jgi:hypothetical protein
VSNALAVAAVTAVLKDLLINGLIDGNVPGVTVSALPPDQAHKGNGQDDARLNLCLYQLTLNPGWRNAGLPSRDDRGQRIGNPPLALDLHYLLTAYGKAEFDDEILLGYGMQVLHETPGLGREAIRIALGASGPVTGAILPGGLTTLLASELADQVEQIKISAKPLTLDELTKLWSAFQTPYRASVAYEASVVLIESRRSTRVALPVRTRNLYALPFRQPVIESLRSRAAADEPIVEDPFILAGHQLVIEGRRLVGEATVVLVGGVEVTPAGGDASDRRIVVAVPTTLRAGIQGVQVAHRIDIGTPPDQHRGVESNLVAFVLHPVVESVTLPAPHAAMTMTVEPRIGKEQRVVLLLNEWTATPPTDRPTRAYSFPAPAGNGITAAGATETASVTIPIRGVAPGAYLVRIQVDGAESPLASTGGRYDGPKVTVP